jgi:hypothetical protein
LHNSTYLFKLTNFTLKDVTIKLINNAILKELQEIDKILLSNVLQTFNAEEQLEITILIKNKLSKNHTEKNILRNNLK